MQDQIEELEYIKNNINLRRINKLEEFLSIFFPVVFSSQNCPRLTPPIRGNAICYLIFIQVTAEPPAAPEERISQQFFIELSSPGRED